MLPVSNPSSPERLLKGPDNTALDRKNSLNSLISSSLLRPYISPRSHRLWLLLCVLCLQLLLLLTLRSIPFPHHRSADSFPSPAAVVSSISGDSLEAPLSTRTQPGEDSDGCELGRVFVYEMPKIFNEVILQHCDNLNPWSSRCHALSNEGFGKEATSLSGVIPEDLVPAWFWTDQFVSEIIFHNRILNHRCRTTEPDSATAFYIPFYAGLAVGQYLWSNYTAEDRDRHCRMMTEWVQGQPQWNRSNGWDHFITMGRITWDFRRSNDQDWGSSCIYLPGMRNITRLLIERNPWDYFDVAVPYPTGFHPRSNSDIVKWQEFVRTRRRRTLFCFAGAPRAGIKNDFRGLLLHHCEESRGTCRTVDCGGGRCSNGSSAILETFLDSDFCLQPRGDSFTRRSIFDCMVAGSIPVVFWHRTAYLQYKWFLPDEPGSYSVFIDRDEVKNGTTSIREVLERYSREEVERMRERVIDSIPRLVYARSPNGLEGLKDAFDVALEGVFRRFKEQENWYKWR
ncbi:PREDICTED: xyloglucan galactosyltransferase XLT2 [Tarenaya hassleriana]|uniref:xyloglucan galactosyltransferase XLT2 n=1 Tax=Tarenaya hassleriana TaxID=28532 RepID=UPI00053C45AF|nr:PREDICTED: xyloglucan galactosyltransferase XLT2 [Tarenaya hassleriana]